MSARSLARTALDLDPELGACAGLAVAMSWQPTDQALVAILTGTEKSKDQ